MNAGAIIMLIFGVLFLYGGITYFIVIALRSKEKAVYGEEASEPTPGSESK